MVGLLKFPFLPHRRGNDGDVIVTGIFRFKHGHHDKLRLLTLLYIGLLYPKFLISRWKQYCQRNKSSIEWLELKVMHDKDKELPRKNRQGY